MTTHKGQVTIEDALDEDEYEIEEEDRAAVARNTTHSASSSSSSPDNTNRGGLSPGTESAFEIWLRHNVNQPLLDHVVPEWITPNTISFINTFACWAALMCGYVAYRYGQTNTTEKQQRGQTRAASHIALFSAVCVLLSEHVYPVMSCSLRILMGFLIFAGISLDCLDGMQARKTGRCSKLGEVLDHSFDAANVPIIGCCVLMTMNPDIYTIIISLIGGNMIYNAQLVIYRYHHVFVLPPVTGPAAQAVAALASVGFGIFFLFFSRHNYFVQVFITIFAMLGNIAQYQNCSFYFHHLTSSFETSCLWPHLRFTAVMSLHGLLLLTRLITPMEYMLSAILLAYRLNGKYVLDTLLNFKPFTALHTKEALLRADEKELWRWRWECMFPVVVLFVIALVYGTGTTVVVDELGPHTITLQHVLTDSLFHAGLYLYMAGCVALNAYDLITAIPVLATK